MTNSNASAKQVALGILTVSILFVSSAGRIRAAETCGVLSPTKSVQGSKDIEATAAHLKSCAIEAIYQLWQMEKLVGAKADPPGANYPETANSAENQYVKNNRANFVYSEAAGSYYPSDKHVETIRAIDPSSPRIAEIEYEAILRLDRLAGEDGDRAAVIAIIMDKYLAFARKYPASEFSRKASSRAAEMMRTRKKEAPRH